MDAEPEPESETFTPNMGPRAAMRCLWFERRRKSFLQRHQGFTAHREANEQAKSASRSCLDMFIAHSYGGHTFGFTYTYRY